MGHLAQGVLVAAAVVGALAGLTGCVSGPVERPGTGVKLARSAEPEDIDAALRRGARFLVGYQNKDGSWGTARRTKALNVYAPVPGSHRSFRVAVTALCVMALGETDLSAEPAAADALARGEAYLLAELPKVRRDAAGCLYNNWTHAYGIRALVRMLARGPDDRQRHAEIRRQIAQQVDFLKRFECINGGWGYYDRNAKTQRTTAYSMSFMTATVLIALHEARGTGIDVPSQLVARAIDALKRQRKPDMTYLYSAPFRYAPMRDINLPGGSLGRTQACNLALRLWGDGRITDAVLSEWLTRLCDRNGWLSRARKMPVPHESWFHVSGYFFYYGHFYAAGCIEALPAASRPPHRQGLARVLLALQEKDGSWWDYPLYDYHQGWGTAMAMMALKRCRPTGPEQPHGH